MFILLYYSFIFYIDYFDINIKIVLYMGHSKINEIR